jgi:hypothetical protein
VLDETGRPAVGRMYGQSHSRGMNVLMSFARICRSTRWRNGSRCGRSRSTSSGACSPTRRSAADSCKPRITGLSRVVGAEARKPDWKELRIHDGPFPPYPLVADVARERGCDPVDLMIDLALQNDFDQFFIQSAIPGRSKRSPTCSRSFVIRTP